MDEQFSMKRKSLGEECEKPKDCPHCGCIVLSTGWHQKIELIGGKEHITIRCNKCFGDILKSNVYYD